MSEHFLHRMRRVITAGVENAVDKAERAAAPSVMRQSIREVERMIDRSRAGMTAARTRADQAQVRQQVLRDRIAELAEQARCAVDGKRNDLAEAALTRQLDLEAQIARLDGVKEEALREAAELEAGLPGLESARADMEHQLGAFDIARRDAVASSDLNACAKVDQSLERARKAFDRAMAAGSDSEMLAERKLAEIDDLKRESIVAERLAALRGDKAAKRPSRRAR